MTRRHLQLFLFGAGILALIFFAARAAASPVSPRHPVIYTFDLDQQGLPDSWTFTADQIPSVSTAMVDLVLTVRGRSGYEYTGGPIPYRPWGWHYSVETPEVWLDSTLVHLEPYAFLAITDSVARQFDGTDDKAGESGTETVGSITTPFSPTEGFESLWEGSGQVALTVVAPSGGTGFASVAFPWSSSISTTIEGTLTVYLYP